MWLFHLHSAVKNRAFFQFSPWRDTWLRHFRLSLWNFKEKPSTIFYNTAKAKPDGVRMKKKFAFLLMGKEFDTAKDAAIFETEHMISYIFTVTSFEEALKRAVACAEDGVGAIEVCGAFGKEWADKIIAATGNRVAVGYVVHNPEQDALFERFFAKA